jgi:hypothetical protein
MDQFFYSAVFSSLPGDVSESGPPSKATIDPPDPHSFPMPSYTSRNRDLDEDIKPVQRGPQPVHFHQRSVGVVRQVGIDLQTTTAIFTARGVVDRPERVGHAPDIALTEGFVDGRGALSLE